jgi:hypothetical protein
MRVLAFLAAAVALSITGAGAAGASGACSKKAAVAAVLASSLSQHWKDEAAHKYGPIEGLQGVTCRDFTRDGNADMALSFYSGGTAGDVAWVAFRRAGNSWKLALARLQNYKQSLAFRGSDIIETQPIYLKGDANCCPSGGFDHRRFHWNGAKFVVARFWHDKTYRV